MKLHSLKPSSGSVKKSKRIGRGTGSTRGGTSTRGHKGAKSRSGNSTKRAFEGGQMPLQRRIPKRGFKNFTRVEYVPINLETIEHISEKYSVKEISPESLYSLGIISKTDKIKILGNGDLNKSVKITAHRFSAKAKEVIESKGGEIVQL